MSKALYVCLALVAVGVPAAVSAAGPVLAPVPESQLPSGSAVVVDPAIQPGAQPVPAGGNAIPLYHCVKVCDEHNIAPCAVPMIVMVKDPCDCRGRCSCEAPRCVAVEICVPPCSTCPPKICCKREGAYVKYDFGKYRVEIRSRRGVVTVDYDD